MLINAMLIVLAAWWTLLGEDRRPLSGIMQSGKENIQTKRGADTDKQEKSTDSGLITAKEANYIIRQSEAT